MHSRILSANEWIQQYVSFDELQMISVFRLKKKQNPNGNIRPKTFVIVSRKITDYDDRFENESGSARPLSGRHFVCVMSSGRLASY